MITMRATFSVLTWLEQPNPNLQCCIPAWEELYTSEFFDATSCKSLCSEQQKNWNSKGIQSLQYNRILTKMTWGKGIASSPESQNSPEREENCDEQCFRWDDSPFFILQAVHDIWVRPIWWFGETHPSSLQPESQSGENFLIPLAISMWTGNNNRQNVEFRPALKETDCGTSRTLRRSPSIFHRKKLVESTCQIVSW